MMRRIRAVLAAAVLAALMATTAAAPAAANVITWPTLPCATGAMTAEAMSARLVYVTGWIQPCAGSPASAGSFAVIYYGPSYGGPRRLLSYADPAAPTPFGGYLDKTPFGDGLNAACLAFSETGRLSCVSFAAGDDPDRLVVTPVPVDHPLVTVPIIIPPKIGQTNPTCGTCV